MIYILYHASCPDGFWSAFAAWLKFGDEATYIPVNYNEDPPQMEPGSRVYIVDFSYKRPILEKLIEKNQVTVIDHHKTAEEDLRDLENVYFDLNHSGCVLTYNYFHGANSRHILFDYVEDRDLWRWKLPDSKEINAALFIQDRTFLRCNELIKFTDINTLLIQGKTILKVQGDYVSRAVKNRFIHIIDGQQIPVVNSSVLQSEIGDALCELCPYYPFVGIFYQTMEKRFWSLRSRNGFDCSAVAKKFGGGGHPGAAGFVEVLE
jgi:nanoRNase/pAp phosphatase (c-di-AMP/oligoRNAs hydrolase)